MRPTGSKAASDSGIEQRTKKQAGVAVEAQHHQLPAIRSLTQRAPTAVRKFAFLNEVAHIRHRVEKCEDQIRQAEASRATCDEKVATLEEELASFGDVKDLGTRREELAVRIKDNKAKLVNLKNSERAILESKAGVDANITNFEQRIRDEHARLETRSKEKRDRTMEKLAEANASLAEKEQRLKTMTEERTRLLAEADSARKEGERLQIDKNEWRDRVAECDQQISRCADMEKSKLAQFGSQMEQVLAHIRQRKWHGRPPVGPFGLYVKVKDAEKCGPLLRVVIGNAMGNFAITDGRDRQALNDILKRAGNHNTQIIISEVDLFDFSAGEPPQNYLTILRALEVSDDYILRQLVNNLHIESTLLAANRAEADQMLVSLGSGGVAMAADLYRVVRFPRWQGQRDEFEARRARLSEQIADLESTYNRCRKLASDLEPQISQHNKAVRGIRTEINNIQLELNDELPVNIQSLHDALTQQRTEKADIMEQYEQLIKEREKVQQDQRPLVAESERLRLQIAAHGTQRGGVSDRLNEAVAERMNADNSIVHFTSKADVEREKLTAAEEVGKTLEEEFQAWSAKASKYCDPVAHPRKVDVVQRAVDAAKAALAEREKRQGATIEEIASDMHRKQASLDTAKSELRALNSLNNALKKSVKQRLARWHEFRRHIALRCKVYFAYHLSNRGYFGKVLFDHVNSTLNLKVQTDDQAATQTQAREKDPRSLSGGEKSFSTICLLLSLWESIGCPIRCLDEFDVFMDAVNRRISMKMMIETANTSRGKQYVLITPQDMNNVNPGNTVRVHRMSDPERGQGTLAFR
ncbi:hypothetical protein BC628DRAFT_1418807 [Trametes gibbosa]|nr:hypothetical protein BC628DRAFT_1418807 [Trametes gibbosa]